MVWKFYGFSSEEEHRRQVPNPLLMVLEKDRLKVQEMINSLVLGRGRVKPLEITELLDKLGECME